MKILISADWQADFSNLDQCELAKQEVFQLAIRNHVKLIIIVGDAKQQYNPVDTRVVRFWMGFILEAKEMGLAVHFLLGNHDRIGQYADAQNWLSILSAAGAETYDSPTAVNLVGDVDLYYLPYISSLEKLKKAAKGLAREAKTSRNPRLLFFHCDIYRAKYSLVSSETSKTSFTVDDLYPERYHYCIGGHLHLAQQLRKNVMYVGNPFACDWGEANQQKRYLLFDSQGAESLNCELTSIPSAIPGWYDKSVVGFKPPRDWTDCKLRIHVEVSEAENYVKAINRAREKAEKKYRGALVFTVAEFIEQQKDKDVTLSANDPDHVKIRAYVEQTVPVELRKQTEKLISYLTFKLGRVSKATRALEGITFLWSKVRNMLSFEELKVDYRKQGIVVVQGEHQNWPRRSNGSGKTNFLQPPPIAMFGRTFKGQKNDAWARERTKDAAEVTFAFRDSKGRKIKIVRARRPAKLQLFIDGVDESAGMRSNQKNGTQLQIEQISGFTWSTLANAVYIDSAVTNAFLAGTTKARAEVLAKIQNLERFDAALKLVSVESHALDKEIDRNEEEKATALAALKEAKELLGDLKVADEAQYNKAKVRLTKLQDLFHQKEKAYKVFAAAYEAKRDRLTKKHAKVDRRVLKLDSLLQVIKDKIRFLSLQIAQSQKLQTKLECPTCHQSIDKSLLADTIEAWLRTRERKEEKLQLLAKRRQKVFERSHLLEGEHDSLAMEIAAQERTLEPLSAKIEVVYDQCAELKELLTTDNEGARKLKKKIAHCRQQLRILERLSSSLQVERMFFDYCISALSRDGIPLFLNKQLCPVLNKAAQMYSEIFSENEIQVRFNVVDGEFLPYIVNAHGSAATKGQSDGERALAGVITSFALREVTPLCNILALDEPGRGLDSENAKCFARGLRKLRDRFDTIFVVTHNPVILGELSGETTITVTKKNGISSVK